MSISIILRSTKEIMVGKHDSEKNIFVINIVTERQRSDLL